MFLGARRLSWRGKGGNWTQQALRPLGFQNYRESWDLPVLGESGLETALFLWRKDGPKKYRAHAEVES